MQKTLFLIAGLTALPFAAFPALALVLAVLMTAAVLVFLLRA